MNMEYENALIGVLLAEVMLRMGLPQKALQSMKNSMDYIYINGGLYDRAKTDFTFVRCLVKAGHDRNIQQQRLRKALPILERAIESHRKLEAHAKVLDVFVYVAKTFDELGVLSERNKYACKLKNYYTENPVPREYLNAIY
uniref:Uncharacterized protein n=1 Tax=Glossina austeni TaxID=7395 RepID=A0A1A9V859_GLOAU